MEFFVILGGASQFLTRSISRALFDQSLRGSNPTTPHRLTTCSRGDVLGTYHTAEEGEPLLANGSPIGLKVNSDQKPSDGNSSTLDRSNLRQKEAYH